MATTEINKVFKGVFRIPFENQLTVAGRVLNSDSYTFIANKTLTKGAAGYSFSHVFTEVGLYLVEVTATSGAVFFETVTVTDTPTDVWNHIQ